MPRRAAGLVLCLVVAGMLAWRPPATPTTVLRASAAKGGDPPRVLTGGALFRHAKVEYRSKLPGDDLRQPVAHPPPRAPVAPAPALAKARVQVASPGHATTYNGIVPIRGPPRTSGAAHHGYATALLCVEMVENGGSYGRSGNPTHFGRYQFDRGTWAAYGGNPATWGIASPAEQDRVFFAAVAAGDLYHGWLEWDSC